MTLKKCVGAIKKRHILWSKSSVSLFFIRCSWCARWFPSTLQINLSKKDRIGQQHILFLDHEIKFYSFFVTISPKIRRLSFPNHRIRLIWHRVTFGYSQNSTGNAFRVEWRV